MQAAPSLSVYYLGGLPRANENGLWGECQAIPDEFSTYKTLVELTEQAYHTARLFGAKVVSPRQNHRGRCPQMALRPDGVLQRNHLVSARPALPAEGPCPATPRYPRNLKIQRISRNTHLRWWQIPSLQRGCQDDFCVSNASAVKDSDNC